MAKKINLEQMAAGGLSITIEDGTTSKHINLTQAELSELSPRLAALAADGDLKKIQQEVEENELIPDDFTPDSEAADDNDLIPG
jgi:hypothetical protein